MGLGFSQREAVLIIYLIAGVLGMVALYVTEATIPEGYLLGGLVGLIAVYWIWYLDVKIDPRPEEYDDAR